ncbi:Flp family type IVb pilin [Aneurinibacillus tyrosinisolvens]|uniref:Flp family type IVb pilin n=1 Tax=Aneurinibacillus tyrosinisolvens TaxID=1443435 RepID=UPI00063F693C|nr:hypothetical protein [Aneurinibacillus tyrosinisolvens]
MFKKHIQKTQEKMMVVAAKTVAFAQRFNENKKATPSIETVAIVALVALAIFSNLEGLGQAVSNIFGSLTSKLNSTIK